MNTFAGIGMMHLNYRLSQIAALQKIIQPFRVHLPHLYKHMTPGPFF